MAMLFMVIIMYDTCTCRAAADMVERMTSRGKAEGTAALSILG